MKIMICGSMSCAKEMLATQKKLGDMGYEAFVPCDTEVHISNPDLTDNLDAAQKHVMENDVLRRCFEMLASCDAVLFLNFAKNGIDGYIGTSALMEMGLAYYLRKQIYVLFPYPKSSEVRWASEVEIIHPTVLNGDIRNLIK